MILIGKMFMLGNCIYDFHRKLNPPIPTIKNRISGQNIRPKIFEEYGIFDSDNGKELDNYYFDNWSFVKNTEK